MPQTVVNGDDVKSKNYYLTGLSANTKARSTWMAFNFQSAYNPNFQVYLSCQNVNRTLAPKTYKSFGNMKWSDGITFYDETISSFDVFIINLSDVETLACVVISQFMTMIFIAYALKTFHKKQKHNHIRKYKDTERSKFKLVLNLYIWELLGYSLLSCLLLIDYLLKLSSPSGCADVIEYAAPQYVTWFDLRKILFYPLPQCILVSMIIWWIYLSVVLNDENQIINVSTLTSLKYINTGNRVLKRVGILLLLTFFLILHIYSPLLQHILWTHIIIYGIFYIYLTKFRAYKHSKVFAFIAVLFLGSLGLTCVISGITINNFILHIASCAALVIAFFLIFYLIAMLPYFICCVVEIMYLPFVLANCFLSGIFLYNWESLVFWEPLTIVLCVLLFLGVFTTFPKNTKLRIFKNFKLNEFVLINISIFLYLLDLTTDWNLIIQWILSKNYIWACAQLVIIISTQIISTNNIGHKSRILKLNLNLINANSISTFDKIMTLIGLGRAWMGCKTIIDKNLYYEEYSSMKIDEIEYESIPTVALQLYVALANYYLFDNKQSLSLVASIAITLVSMTFSIWKVFYNNAQNYKFSKNRISSKNSKQTMSIDTSISDIARTRKKVNDKHFGNKKLGVTSMSPSGCSTPTAQTLSITTPAKIVYTKDDDQNDDEVNIIGDVNTHVHFDDIMTSNELNLVEMMKFGDNDLLSNVDENNQYNNEEIVAQDVTSVCKIDLRDDITTDDEHEHENIYSKSDSINRTSHSRSATQISSTNLNNMQQEKKAKNYGKVLKLMIFCYLYFDFYCRSFVLLYSGYLVRVFWDSAQHDESPLHQWIIIIGIGLLMLLSLIAFEIYFLHKMQKSNKPNWDHVCRHLLVSLFSNIINLLFVLPLKKMKQKHDIHGYVISSYLLLFFVSKQDLCI